MSDSSFHSNSFVDRAESIILENVSNEQFGVSELAEVMNTSRSNLVHTVWLKTRVSIDHVQSTKIDGYYALNN